MQGSTLSPLLCSPHWPWWFASSWAPSGPPTRTCGWRGGLFRTSSTRPRGRRDGSPCVHLARPAQATSFPWVAVSSSRSPGRTFGNPAAGTWALSPPGSSEPFQLWDEVASSSPWQQLLTHSSYRRTQVSDYPEKQGIRVISRLRAKLNELSVVWHTGSDRQRLNPANIGIKYLKSPKQRCGHLTSSSKVQSFRFFGPSL